MPGFPESTTTVPVGKVSQQGSVEDRLRLLVNKLVAHAQFGMPGCLTSAPAVKTGTTSAKTWRNELFTYATRGLKASKAATETAFTATTHDVAASKQAWFVLTIASGGALTITKAADQNIGTDLLPEGPDNQIVVGYLKIVTGSGGIWDATTDDLTPPGAPTGNLVSVTHVDGPDLIALLPVQ
jgi:hypothetical protein